MLFKFGHKRNKHTETVRWSSASAVTEVPNLISVFRAIYYWTIVASRSGFIKKV